MKNYALFFVAALMIVFASCKKYDYSEGELSTVNPRFIQLENVILPPNVNSSLVYDYNDTLFTPHSNGGTDTVMLVIDNPYNIPFSFNFQNAPSGGFLNVYDMSWNNLDKLNLNNNGDTVIIRIQGSALAIGQGENLAIDVKHQDYLIRTNHYYHYREY